MTQRRRPVEKIFVLSPAQCGGPRAGLLTSPRASFPLALRLRAPEGAPLGDVFSFLSGLYFRGKLAYARHFARPPRGMTGVRVITAGRGLMMPEEPITLAMLRELAAVPVHLGEPRYHEPLRRHLAELARQIGRRCAIVFLGSIATPKYLDLLREPFGESVLVPATFAGRGDMSRGGLLLRSVREDQELDYVPAPSGRQPRGPRFS